MRYKVFLLLLVCFGQNVVFAQHSLSPTMIGIEVGKALVFPASTKGTFLEVQLKQKVFKEWYLHGAFGWGNHYPVYGATNGRYLMEPLNIDTLQTKGIAIRAGLLTHLKNIIRNEKFFFMFGGQLFYGNTTESLALTIKNPYFGNASHKITHQNMHTFGIGAVGYFIVEIIPRLNLSLEGSLSICNNPAPYLTKPDNIQIYPFYLKGAGVVINPRAEGILFGANAGLKLFYLFSKKS